MLMREFGMVGKVVPSDRQTDRQTVLCAVPGDDDEAGEGKESEE